MERSESSKEQFRISPYKENNVRCWCCWIWVRSKDADLNLISCIRMPPKSLILIKLDLSYELQRFRLLKFSWTVQSMKSCFGERPSDDWGLLWSSKDIPIIERYWIIEKELISRANSPKLYCLATTLSTLKESSHPSPSSISCRQIHLCSITYSPQSTLLKSMNAKDHTNTAHTTRRRQLSVSITHQYRFDTRLAQISKQPSLAVKNFNLNLPRTSKYPRPWALHCCQAQAVLLALHRRCALAIAVQLSIVTSQLEESRTTQMTGYLVHTNLVPSTKVLKAQDSIPALQ